MYNPTNNDLELVTRGIRNVYTRIEAIDSKKNVLGVIKGEIKDGTLNIDSSSSVRRTFSITIVPDADSIFAINNFSKFIDCTYKLYTVVYDERNERPISYANGEYIIQKLGFTYDAKSNLLKVEASDLMTRYNGTISGNLPAFQTKILPYKVDILGNPVQDENGNLTYFVIKDELIGYLKYVGIEDYMILEDIGEYRGIEHYNPEYLEYREKHPQWNTVPYEIDLSPTDSYETIFNKLCTFYSNYDYAFDEDGVFVLRMIPSTYEDNVVMDNSIIQNVLLADNSENANMDITQIKNVSIVWGKCFEPDYYAETSTYANNVYSVNLDYISAYENDNIFAVTITTANADNPYMKINNLELKMIFDEATDTFIKAGTLTPGVWCFKYRNNVMYLLGQYQIHAVNILSDGTDPTYTESYFKEKYNCDTVGITTIPDSPFTIEKIGLREKSYNDETCQNLASNSLALSYAEHLTWQTARTTDELTLSCTLIPWLREYTKFSYKPKYENEERQYMIKSISHDFGSGTTTITAYRFYPLYEK